MPEIDSLLEKVPKKTPAWAIGIVTILVAVTASLVTIYVTSSDPIKQYITWAQSDHEREDAVRFKIAQDAEESIMQILQKKSEQILELSKAVATTQQNNFTLLQRVSALEKDMESLKGTLTTCEQSLKDCRKQKGL